MTLPVQRLSKDATDLVVNVASVDCRNYSETQEMSGTLQAKTTQGYSLNYQNPVRSGYVVRRLMPVECERLQGYEDDWTKYGDDGKLISDTRRYQMLGNSVALPCVAYILMGIAEHMRLEKEPAALYADESGCPSALCEFKSDWKEAA